MQLHDVPHTVTAGEIALQTGTHLMASSSGQPEQDNWVGNQFFYRSDALSDAQPTV